MRQFSAAGQQTIEDIAERHAFSPDAVASMLRSVLAGRGRMAQFGHPEFGGAGQWMRGGMTMVSDMFNTPLKTRVERLCDELSQLVAADPDLVGGGLGDSLGDERRAATSSAGGVQPHAPPKPVSLFLPAPAGAADWWPADLGRAASAGAQDGIRYAYFPATRRLAIDAGGSITIYDTLDHRISGVSQQQSGRGSLTFSSQHGVVEVATLPVMSGDARPQPATDIVATIEKLAQLQSKGILTAAEFAAKKTELLSRL